MIKLNEEQFDVIVQNLTNRNKQHIDIANITSIIKSISCMPSNSQHIISPFFIYAANDNSKDSFSFIWGNAKTIDNFNAIESVLNNNGNLILCEDGFLRSYDTWCSSTASDKDKTSCSTIFDSSAYYFDATRPSDIEKMLNDQSVVVDDIQRKEARRLMKKIVDNKLSKYNHQPIEDIEVGRSGKKKVLVVDQSYGDFSIKKGLANEATFEKMLNVAISENPDCDIIVKTHPDTMTGNRGGYFTQIKQRENVFKQTLPINPYSLLSKVDKVYVCSTQFGFEALMAGKEVHTFGMPFYANWGITIDDQKLLRRTNRRTLEEIFYLFYCVYTHWYNPDTKQACNIDESIDYLLKLRNSHMQTNKLKV